MTLEQLNIKKVIEAALFAFGKPLTLEAIVNLFQEEDGVDKATVRDAIASIEEDCEARGVELKKVSSGYRFQAKQDFAKWLQPLWEEKPPRYSRALLETMVLIAYKQPITRGEIEDVRGVSVSTHIVKTLQERDWIRVVGHRDVPGKPALFATTKGFLDYFNLSSLDQLPSLAQIRDLDKINEELDLSKDAEAKSTDIESDVEQNEAASADQSDSADTQSDESFQADPVEFAVIEQFLADESDQALQHDSALEEDDILPEQDLDQVPTEMDRADEIEMVSAESTIDDTIDDLQDELEEQAENIIVEPASSLD